MRWPTHCSGTSITNHLVVSMNCYFLFHPRQCRFHTTGGSVASTPLAAGTAHTTSPIFLFMLRFVLMYNASSKPLFSILYYLRIIPLWLEWTVQQNNLMRCQQPGHVQLPGGGPDLWVSGVSHVTYIAGWHLSHLTSTAEAKAKPVGNRLALPHPRFFPPPLPNGNCSTVHSK